MQIPTDGLALRLKLFSLIKERSIRRGKFTLVSGRESNYYLDLKPTMLDPEGATLLPELILRRLEEMEVDFVGGVALGAVPLIAPLTAAAYRKGRHIPAFFVRKLVKDHGTKRLIEGLPAEELRGRKVVVLDDVTTTGESVMIAVKAAQEAGADVRLVLSVVDREEGASEYFRRAGVAFDSLFRASEFLAS